MDETLRTTFEIARALVEAEERSDVEVPPTPEELAAQLDLGLPREGLGREEALARVRSVVELTPKTSSRRFFNQLFAGREPVAGAAEMLTGLLNVSMYTYKVAGVHTLIENEIVHRLCELAGFADGEGTFVPGGSLGNLVCMAMAAYERRPGHRDEGVSGARLRFYLSDDGHYSVRKNAGLLGIGRANVRRIPVDERGHMRCDVLVRRIEEDRAQGHEPCCVVATAGTTVLGAFDDLEAVGAVAREQGLWFHVDGCLGATFLLHPRLREKLRGVQRADSLTWNPHKLMGIPLPCAAVLVPRRGLLRRHFDEAADYLYQQDSQDLNLGTKSIQCGRRNDAFKLWAAWQELGDEGWRLRIERQMALVRAARDRVVAHSELELVAEPESLNLCFNVRDKPSDELCERLGREGLELVGYGVVGGRKVIRLVLVHPALSEDDLDRFFDDLLTVAREVPSVASTVSSS